MKVKKFISYWNEEVSAKRKAREEHASKFSGVDFPVPGDDKKNKDGEEEGKEKPDLKLYIGNLPPTMKEDYVRKICESFGALKSFNLVKDPMFPERSKGYAFFEYADDRAVEKAIRGLNNLEFQDKRLKVQKAST